ncbi:SUN domain-containing protein 3-like [Pezoporus wallicus]|uniref:SUN domain-containing protein 3-like n=1 Tax=Pezoporus wallicus TaxID=35540 RepID=UPI0025518E85|nr:SUN domain-containing protein 3-like [Pezoporus wallicus]
MRNSQAQVNQDFKQKVPQVYAARGRVLNIVREVLKDHAVQEEQIEEILQLTEVAIKKVLENYVLMPDWALEAIGASIDEERTSKSYGGEGMMTWLLSLFTFLFANPPVTILQPSVTPGNCWPFHGSQGHVVIRLPVHIWPTAFTVWHISEAVSPSGEVSSAPREFTVFGVDEATAETLLGTFTYDVHKGIAQTFHVQKELPGTFRYIKFQVQSNWGNQSTRKELPGTFRYIKFQVQSNWGNPEYTCVYRVQVHGTMASHTTT